MSAVDSDEDGVMARAFSRARRGPLVVSQKRASVWAFVDVDSIVVGANSKVLVASLNAAALALRPFTIVRTHLTVFWESDQVAAAERPLGAFGMIVVTDQARAAGAGSVPHPVNEADASWFAWQGLISSLAFASGTGFVEPSGSSYSVDSKAMRKVGINEDMVLMAGNVSAAGGAILSIQGRFLLKMT